MLGVTSYLATDVASVPLLWVVPLALYLITFVLAFSSWGDRTRALAAASLPLLALSLVLLLLTKIVVPFYLTIIVHLSVFTIASLNCHGELAAERPPADTLTDFYLWMAVGGVVGGLFNSLIAPLIFTSIAEYPIVLTIACALMRPRGLRPPLRVSLMDLAVAAMIGVFTAGLLLSLLRLWIGPQFLIGGSVLAAVAAFTQARRPVRFALCVGAMLAAGVTVERLRADALHRERTFFGVYRVETDDTGSFRRLYHGTTLHGMQSLDPARRSEPLTYYTRSGPFGVAYSMLPSVTTTSRVAAVGLGAGTLSAYARGDQHWTFFEIDPAVERIARTPAYFTYLADCGERCTVVIGDARQSLTHTDSVYDLMVLDAFSSDAIPLHLLNREALRVYLGRLAPGGVLAFHISNRHLALMPVLARLAESEQLSARDWFDAVDAAPATGKAPAEWLLMARHDSDLGSLVRDARWIRPDVPPSTPLWTDDFTNIWSVLKRR